MARVGHLSSLRHPPVTPQTHPLKGEPVATVRHLIYLFIFPLLRHKVRSGKEVVVKSTVTSSKGPGQSPACTGQVAGRW